MTIARKAGIAIVVVLVGGAFALTSGYEGPVATEPMESDSCRHILHGAEPWLMLFTEEPPSSPCVAVGVHQDIQIWNKGFDTLRIGWHGTKRLQPDTSIATGPIGDLLEPGTYLIESAPYPAPLLVVVDPSDSPLTSHRPKDDGWGPVTLGDSVAEIETSLGANFDVTSDGICEFATVTDPYSPVFHVDEQGTVAGIDVSYPRPAFIGSDCRH